MASHPTVRASWLLSAAAQLERDANESLPAWILLRQASERYPEAMRKAAAMRRAAQIRNIGERRDFLRANGVDA